MAAERGTRESAPSGEEMTVHWNNNNQQAETRLLPRLEQYTSNNLSQFCNTHTDRQIHGPQWHQNRSECRLCANNVCHEDYLTQNELNSKQKTTVCNKFFTFLLTIFISTIVIGGGVAALYVYKISGLTQYCVPCPKEGSVTETKCTSNKEDSILLITKCLDEIQRDHMSKQRVSSPPFRGFHESQIMHHSPSKVTAVAHLRIRPNPTFSNQDKKGMYNVTSWKTVVRQNVTVSPGHGSGPRDGQIIIEKSGDYFVYNQVHFLKPKHVHSKISSVVNALYRYSYDKGEEELLRSTEVIPILPTPTPVGGQKRPRRRYQHTGYIGAPFALKRGDRIYVKVNNREYMHDRKESTYYGLFMINKGTD